ncbi:MAG TPA: helix-turn-helix domain-containing protein [Tepidisphaeraceae bacterium]|jgi:predicted DNA-binding transcriptional regulator AlpA
MRASHTAPTSIDEAVSTVSVVPVAPPEFVDEPTMAARLGCTRKHLENLRSRGVGPRPYKFGRLIRYCVPEVMAWVAAQRIANTAQGVQLEKKAKAIAAGLLTESEAANG